MDKSVERFLRYISIDTTSNMDSNTVPSTEGQLVLANLIASELNEIGIKEVEVSKNGYVYGIIPHNTEGINAIGFIAHMDTSPDSSGKNVNPKIIKNYNGNTINLRNSIEINPDKFHDLKDYIGEDIIVTDGTTLLGADDKSGISAIICAVEEIINSHIKHGDIYLAFTPDEEIGRGMDNFDLTKFKPDFAYTINGGKIGELEYENFNAARARIKITGISVHPGYAKGILKNAVLIGNELLSMLPQKETPFDTSGYEGFFHVNSFAGSVEEVLISIIIRDFVREEFEIRKSMLIEIVEELNRRYNNCINIDLKDEYFNMSVQIKPHMHIIKIAEKAMFQAGVKPIIKPIRGGTDGSRLSYMGIPCPNIFAGGLNFHGPYEFLPINSLKKSIEVIVNIIKLVGNGNAG